MALQSLGEQGGVGGVARRGRVGPDAGTGKRSAMMAQGAVRPGNRPEGVPHTEQSLDTLLSSVRTSGDTWDAEAAQEGTRV